MFRIVVYNNTGTTPIATLFRPIIRSWGKKNSDYGEMIFSLPISDTAANATNLQLYRQVDLLRRKRDGSPGYAIAWSGHIMQTKRNGPVIDVLCAGHLHIFTKDVTTNDQTFTGQAQADIGTLLSTRNASDSGNGDTGITMGTATVTTTNSTKSQGRYDLLRAFQMILDANNGEMEVDDARKLNIVPTLGSDKSAIVTLKFRRDAVPGVNCITTELGEDGAPMINRCYGYTSGGAGYTSTKNSTTNQIPNGLRYPILTEQKQFNEAQSQAALDAMTQRYVDQRANPITEYKIQPEGAKLVLDIVTGEKKIAGLQYEDLVIGDLVNCDIVTENQTVQETRRIAQIDVLVDEQGQETILYTLSKAGIFVTADYLAGADPIGELKRRLREIEAVL